MSLMLTLLATAGQATAACPDPLNVAVAAESAIRSMSSENDPAAALEEVRATHENLDCVESLTPTQDLALLYQTGGAAAWQLGRTNDADRWFEQALVVAPEVPFDERLGGDAAARYRQVQARHGASQLGSLKATGTVWIDGHHVKNQERVEVPYGTHLVQYLTPDGTVASRAVVTQTELTLRVPEGGDALVLDDRSKAARVGGVLLVTAGTASLIGLVFANGEYTEGYIDSSVDNPYPTTLIWGWGSASAAAIIGGTVILTF